MIERIGTAGWSIPKAMADAFPGEGSHLERYARRFDAVEINSSFYRPHRRATYERWAASVPAGFRFSVKLAKAITHERRLIDCADPLARFAEEVAGLGDRLGAVLVQLPPSLAFAPEVAAPFLTLATDRLAAPIACEPRHPSWFTAEADALLVEYRVARVAADPPRVKGGGEPGGWRGLAYFRLHGAPRLYRSAYDADALALWQRRAQDSGARDAWTIFDNTAEGAAIPDALALKSVGSATR